MHDLGFVSAIMAENSFEEVIDFASGNGFRCVELMCWPVGKAERRYAGVTHVDVQTLDAGKGRAISDYAASKNVYVSAMSYYPNPLDADTEKAGAAIDHLKKLIRACRHVGVANVNTFVGRNPMATLEENFRRFAQVWPDIVRLAEDEGVKIGIENCPMYFSTDEWPSGTNMAVSPAIWERMFSLIDSRFFGLNYDPSHMVWQQMDYVQPIHDFKDKLFHIHLKDVKVYTDRLNRVGILATPLEYHTPKLPGLGDVKWGSFFSALTDVRYRGPVCIEVEDRAFEGSPEDRAHALLLARNFLSQFLAH